MNDLIDLGYVGQESFCYGIDTYYKENKDGKIESINVDFVGEEIWVGGNKEVLTFDEIEAIYEMIKDK